MNISSLTTAHHDFIAHARQDIPMFVDDVLRLRKMLIEAGLEVVWPPNAGSG